MRRSSLWFLQFVFEIYVQGSWLQSNIFITMLTDMTGEIIMLSYLSLE
jgi:hypothetical protein